MAAHTNEEIECRRVEVLDRAVKLERRSTLLTVHLDRKEVLCSRCSWLGKRPTGEGLEVYRVASSSEVVSLLCRCEADLL